MKIWLLENGEKTGPHESFVVRDRIEAGELESEVLAWYEGAESWMPLGEVAQFETLFQEEESELLTPPPIPIEALSKHEQLGAAIQRELAKAPPLHPVRRLFARMFDSSLYITLVFVVFQERAIEFLYGESMLSFLAVGLAYVVFDGVMTHVWKSSPGKFLLGMRVTDAVGNAIPLKFAVLRSLRMWILGLGMWMMTLFSLPIAWFMSRKFGYFLWDIPKRYRVVAKPFSGVHVVAYLAGVFVMLSLFHALSSPEMIEELNTRSGAYELMEKWNIPDVK